MLNQMKMQAEKAECAVSPAQLQPDLDPATPLRLTHRPRPPRPPPPPLQYLTNKALGNFMVTQMITCIGLPD